MNALQALIDSAFEERATLSPANAPATLRAAMNEVLDGLDAGQLRVAEKINGEWMKY